MILLLQWSRGFGQDDLDGRFVYARIYILKSFETNDNEVKCFLYLQNYKSSQTHVHIAYKCTNDVYP